jgi:hypothetical protein
MNKKRRNHKLIKKKTIKKKSKTNYFIEDVNKNNIQYVMKSYYLKQDIKSIKNEEHKKTIIVHHISFILAIIILLVFSRFFVYISSFI